MTVTAHPYHLDIAAICDVLMMRPDGSAPACLSMDHTELARNLPSLPGLSPHTHKHFLYCIPAISSARLRALADSSANLFVGKGNGTWAIEVSS